MSAADRRRCAWCKKHRAKSFRVAVEGKILILLRWDSRAVGRQKADTWLPDGETTWRKAVDLAVRYERCLISAARRKVKRAQ